jgi:hypothetical protein
MGHNRRRGFLVAGAVLIATPGALCAQPVATIQRDGFQASVRTLGYDQAASFYLARGLPLPLVERYVRECVVLVAMHSQISAAKVSMRLGDWRVRLADGAAQQIRGRADWLAELDEQGIARSARVAFEWAQLPEDAEFNAGDSIQGMLSVPVARGSAFDLIMRWQVGEDRHEASIEQIRCN